MKSFQRAHMTDIYRKHNILLFKYCFKTSRYPA